MKVNNELTVSINSPQGWLVKELGEVTTVNMGQSPSSTAYNENGIGRYLIQGNADLKNRKTLPRIWTTDFPKTCAVGDIIMTVRAPVGAIARSHHEACLGRGVCSITTNVLNKDYLYHFLVSYESKWKALEQGSTFTAVNGKDIKGIKVLIPTLPEQQKIAEILSTVDEKIEVIVEQIEQTQELKKGLMQRLLTKGIGHTQFKDSPLGQIPESWEVKTLGDIADKISDGIHTTPKYVESSEYHFVNGNNLVNGHITIFPNTKCVSEQEFFKHRKELNENTVLMSINGTIGNLAIYKNEKVVLGKSAAYIICDSTTNAKFIFYLLQSSKMQSYFKGELTGTTISNLSIKSIKNASVAWPSNKEQEEIVNILSTVDEKSNILLNKKIHYQELKKGLMQQLLTGKLRVNHLKEQPELV